ncbi:hypothetical protein [Allopontixanthobacter sp.]|uniref:hypothetical protein n=1 Tax=Allopontixanthobacter sp. TaxID=2906452 RepID=UPI002ABB6A8A|nr:hypothetical protein [Allopontixanthobacter sp.]MDZ4308024.1 hypothetical protein [Allopontixanthobacter sp.]
MSNYEAFKVILITLSGLSKDALHIYIALGVYLGSCLIFGWKARQWRPWLLVLGVAIMGEVWDIQRNLELSQDLNLRGNWKDIWNALLIPTALLVLSRYSTIFAKGSLAHPAGKSGNQP